MSKTQTTKDEYALLLSIDAKLSALLSIMLRANPTAFTDEVSISNAPNAGNLASSGIEDEEVAKILRSTKDSVRKLREKFNKK